MRPAILPVLSTLALGAVLACAPASAQVGYDPYGPPPALGDADGPQYDYARVVDVRPVFAQGDDGRRCYERRDAYAGRDDGYRDDGYYRDGDYRDGGYGDDGYRGTQAGRTAATVIGGVVGAVLGSQIGGGSARYATSAIGTMVGGIAGQRVYENGVRARQARGGTVTVCDPYRDGGYDGGDGTGGSGVAAYDVTYEYAGREYTTRTRYNPGDRIRVRVDVQPYD